MRLAPYSRAVLIEGMTSQYIDIEIMKIGKALVKYQ